MSTSRGITKKKSKKACLKRMKSIEAKKRKEDNAIPIIQEMHKFKSIFDDADYYMLQFEEECLLGTITVQFEKDLTRASPTCTPYLIKLKVPEENIHSIKEIHKGCYCGSALYSIFAPLVESGMDETEKQLYWYHLHTISVCTTVEKWEDWIREVLYPKEKRTHKITWLHFIRRKCQGCGGIRQVHCSC